MKQVLLCICLITGMTWMISCGRGSAPDKVLEKDRFGSVMFEIGLADAYLESYVFRDTSVRRDSAARSELEKVLLANGVSQEQFMESYNYYKAQPVLFKQMMDTVYAKSQRSQEKLYGTRKAGRRTAIPDSLKKGKNVFKQR